MSVQDTLNERGKIYGDYAKHVETRVNILEMLNQHNMRVQGTQKGFSRFEYLLFHDLVMKLVRLAGDPRHVDSVHDLAGYATLYESLINKEEKENASK